MKKMFSSASETDENIFLILALFTYLHYFTLFSDRKYLSLRAMQAAQSALLKVQGTFRTSS